MLASTLQCCLVTAVSYGEDNGCGKIGSPSFVSHLFQTVYARGFLNVYEKILEVESRARERCFLPLWSMHSGVGITLSRKTPEV